VRFRTEKTRRLLTVTFDAYLRDKFCKSDELLLDKIACGLVAYLASFFIKFGGAVHYLMDIEWPVGFLLGAIVSPPDARIAASANGRRH
jgi:NhaP-type Na+/H+ and K+/H+ antiporter